MPTSLGKPLKYEMSRAAKELQVTRLLRAPQMLTNTSLDGVFWRPSLGSFDTRTFTMLVAARTKKTKKQQLCLFLDKCFDLSVMLMSVPAPKQQKTKGTKASYPCGLYSGSVWPDSSAGRSGASVPCHCWYLTDPAGWAASSPALSPHHLALRPTRTRAKMTWVMIN